MVNIQTKSIGKKFVIIKILSTKKFIDN